MAQPILIKRSNVTATPASLNDGELAYSSLSGNLFIGTNGGSGIDIIGGKTDHNKLATIESGAQVNTVFLTANTFTGKQTFANVSTSAASILLPNGSTNPTSPVSGDMWANAGNINWYNGTTTKTIAFTDSNITGTASTASNLVGGNNTTLLGSIPYQSNTNTTTLLAPNTTTTKKFLTETGNGTNGAAPIWNTIVDADIPSTLTGKTYNGLTLTANATGFSVAGGTTSKTLTINNSITLAGTDATTITLPSSSGTIPLNNQQFYIGTTAIAINQATGTVTLPNAALTNSSVTVNGTAISLGGSGTVTANTTNSLIIKADSGTTEGTDLYTFNGSAAKTLDIKAGTNVSITKAVGSITINANDASVAVGEITGLGTGIATFLATPTSSNLASAITDESGSGTLVFSNSPTLVTPNIGVATGTSFNSITGLSSTNPVMNGTVAIGSSTTVARADHVHPSDTTKASLSGATFTGTVTLAADPVSALQAATKQYVDNYALGLDFKQSVLVATTANITLSGTQTIDTIAVVAGDRVLVKNQSTASQNGIYIVAAGAWTRSTDADTSAEVTTGMFMFVEKGSQAGTSWVLTTQGTITIGTTGLTFTQFGGSSLYVAGTGIDITGNTISLAAAGFSASYITSGTLNDARLSSNVLLVSSTIDGGTF